MITNLGSIYDSQLLCLHVNDRVAEEILALEFAFDCFLINRKNDFDGNKSRLIELLAARTTDWIEVFGFNAETIHDAIDVASVRSMRQDAIGDGDPMTAWHDEITDDSDIASYVLTGGYGYCENKLLVVVGTNSDERVLLDAIARIQR